MVLVRQSPWKVRALVTFSAVLLLHGDGLADEVSNPDHTRQLDVPVGLSWVPLSGSAKADVLGMLTVQTQGNYEKIRTWQGTYDVRLKQRLSPQYVMEAFHNDLRQNGVSSVMQEISFTMRFAVDLASKSVYRSQETTAMRFFKDESNEEIELPNTKAPDLRSIVTPEHYLEFSPTTVWPGFSVLPGQSEARQKRAAFRNPPEQAERQSLGDLMDPRDFYSLSVGEGQKFWEVMGLHWQSASGQRGTSAQRKTDERLQLEQADGPKATWYRSRANYSAAGSPVGCFLTIIWRSETGFNPVSLVTSKDKLGKQVSERRAWQWKLVDDVFIPDEMRQSMFDDATGQLTYQRDAKLSACTLNLPLDPHQFDYHGLGVRDGDLIVDKIENSVFVMKQGDLRKLADFHGTSKSTDRQTWFTTTQRWLLVALNTLILFAAVLFLAHRRNRKAKE